MVAKASSMVAKAMIMTIVAFATMLAAFSTTLTDFPLTSPKSCKHGRKIYKHGSKSCDYENYSSCYHICSFSVTSEKRNRESMSTFQKVIPLISCLVTSHILKLGHTQTPFKSALTITKSHHVNRWFTMLFTKL